ncbi:hypothetical protein LSH36_831g00041 [Paralvinella palmiformis]|uniref:RecQ-mediated genome instability protein 1 n=1 Tax=Paralvinella palmiformis TaxID=53620 RepID=A0AAD9IZ55_9ANNE|nr:hypothetical protein LSH36_831g00041 [Paralvinella palmiformis]
MSATDVNLWLMRRYRFQAPLDWLEACCAWLNEENTGSSLSLNELRSQVLSQWLLSDLREIGMRSLPEGLNDQAKILLEGSYCLQVNATYDASSSFYSQLQKVRGTENENVQVSATQNSQSQRPESGRLLMFEMTDGVQSIKGMEYRQLPAVDDSLTPGAKVIISGPVVCRQGVLMLTPENWMLLGGEVDALVENSKVNVLQRVLASNKERDPMETLKQTFSTSEDPARYRDESIHQKATTRNDDDDMDDFLIGVDLSQLDEWEQQLNEPSRGSHTSGLAKEVKRSYIDEVSKDSNVQSRCSTRKLMEGNPSGKSMVQITSIDSSRVGSTVTKHSHVHHTHSDDSTDKQTSDSVVDECYVAEQEPRHPCSNMLWDDDDDFDTIVQTLSDPTDHISMWEQNLENSFVQDNMEQMEIGNHAKGAVLEYQCTIRDNGRKVLTEATQVLDTSQKSSVKATLNTEPYTYLLLVKNIQLSRQLITVKAYVSTLIGRLEHNGGEHWSLTVKLNDGTASRDVDLSDDFLTRLIGFSAHKCHAMKLLAKTCNQTRSRIAQGIRRCQQSLIQLYGLLKMELIPGNQRPMVVGCSAIGEVDVCTLHSRCHD